MSYVCNRIERPCGTGWVLVMAEGRTSAEAWDVYMQHIATGARVPEGPCMWGSREAAEREAERMIEAHHRVREEPADESRSVVCWACRKSTRTGRTGLHLLSHTVEGYYCPGSDTWIQDHPLD